MLAEKTFDTGTVKINYAEGPAHGRPLILLHGTTGRWHGFLPILPQLSFRYHTYALDLRGHGSSGRVPGAYRFVDYAEDVVRFLSEQVREPAALLGHSLGGAIAAQVAADASDLAYALILEEPANPIVRETWVGNEAFTSRIRSWYDLLVTEPSLEEIRAFRASLSPNAAAPDQLARAKSMSRTDPEVLYDVFTDRAIAGFEAEKILPRITCPVLLIQGNPALGGMVEDWEVAWTTPRLKHCTHVYLPDVGHNIHAPQPVVFANLVTSFLESL